MAEASAAAAAPEAPAKKSSKLLIIVLCVLLAVGAAGGGIYFMFDSKEPAAKADAKDTVHKKAEPKAPAVYVAFDPPFVVNFEAKGMMRFLQVSVEVMTRDPLTSDVIKQHDPMLRNELLLLLGSQTYDTISTREGKERLRQEALTAIKNVIASEGGDAGKIEQLYFTSFVMQ